MPAQSYFNVTTTIQQLDAGLTDGQKYVAQNRGGVLVEYTNAATSADAANVSWLACYPSQFFTFTVDTADPVWVRTRKAVAPLAIVDG